MLATLAIMRTLTIAPFVLALTVLMLKAASSPEAIVQAQVDAYNARNIEAFLATYADDAEL